MRFFVRHRGAPLYARDHGPSTNEEAKTFWNSRTFLFFVCHYQSVTKWKFSCVCACVRLVFVSLVCTYRPQVSRFIVWFVGSLWQGKLSFNILRLLRQFLIPKSNCHFFCYSKSKTNLQMEKPHWPKIVPKTLKRQNLSNFLIFTEILLYLTVSLRICLRLPTSSIQRLVLFWLLFSTLAIQRPKLQKYNENLVL